MQINLTPDELKRFWAKVQKGGPDECWLWTASTFRRGYGAFGVRGTSKTFRQMKAHRISYAMAHNGEVPDDLFICHHCDTPGCVNPLHLYAGTPQQNGADRKKRTVTTPVLGTDRWNARFVEDDIRTIRQRRSSGASYYRLSRDYGVCDETIAKICRHETWKHVE